MGLQETLSKKVGPLPLGVWILAVGGGLGLSFYMQRGDGDDAPEDEELEDEFNLLGQPPSFSGAVGLPDFGTQSPLPQPSQAIVSNDQWLSLGVEYLIGRANSAIKAQDALTKYLEGKVLSSSEEALVSQVIRFLGSPPEGAPSVDRGDDVPTPDDGDGNSGDTDTTLFPKWGSDIPADVKARYSSVTATIVLISLNVNPHNWVNAKDVVKGLKALGWSDSEDLKVNLRNVARLLTYARAPKQDDKPTSRPKPSKKKPKREFKWVTVKRGDTLQKIAKRNGTTWQAIWSYNTTPGNRSASTIKTLKKRGPNKIFAGSRFKIPL